MNEIIKFAPKCVQEVSDKKIILDYLNKNSNAFLRENEIAHMTASSWIVNNDRTKVLMVYHNIYNSWSWTGGHMDGESDFLKVALKEASEETGIKEFRILNNGDIYSLEILPVMGHMKRGKYVSCHLHYNVTYLLEASELSKTKAKLDENQAVKWIEIDKVIDSVTEEEMKKVYQKLINRLGEINE